MYVKILYDSEAEKGLIGDWGFSCLVGDETLFDTGSDPNILLHNIRQLGVDLSKVRRVFLSHHHYDHIGGMDVLRELGEVDVFMPSDFPDDILARLTSMGNLTLRTVREEQEIAPDMWSTGEIEGEVKEQALVVRTEKGVTMISGCLHQGWEEALRRMGSIGRTYGLVGGEHDITMEDMEGVSVIVPCHCTKLRTSMHLAHPEQVIVCKVGLVIEI